MPRPMKPERLGLVWSRCQQPLNAGELERILEKDASGHHGQEPPKEGASSFVMLCGDDAEGLSERRARASRKSKQPRLR
jgi:hypothetical protein